MTVTVTVFDLIPTPPSNAKQKKEKLHSAHTIKISKNKVDTNRCIHNTATI